MKVRESPSTSLAVTETVGELSSVELCAPMLVRTGASFTAVTSTVTVASDESTMLSLTMKPKEP